MPLSDKERLQINTLVTRFESATGVQAVAVVTRKAHAYPEIPWKACALGASLGAVAAVLHSMVISLWTDTRMPAAHAMLTLGAGTASPRIALACEIEDELIAEKDA
ncbi:MAG: hypothetical protein JWM26_4167 [Betaproteobacteria bacterium]|nr:hypothetical protein [Betaproteobacteria bacterium]